MEDKPPNYRREFWKSPHHVWFAMLTLGLGFMSAENLGLLAGATLYSLGWIYLPDLGFFRNWVDRRRDAAKQTTLLAEVEEFKKKRAALLASLSSRRRDRYEELVEVCRQIEKAGLSSASPPNNPSLDPRLRKLDELMWTYLRMLGLEESLDRFLETERRDQVPLLVQEGDREAAALQAEIDSLKQQRNLAAADAKERLLNSRLERLGVLHERLRRIEQAQSELALILSEEERLEEQIKLTRAEALASKNAHAFSARIDATVEHLNQTNKWLAQISEFKDMVGDLPPTEMRVGFDAPKPPPVIPTQAIPPRIHNPIPQSSKDKR